MEDKQSKLAKRFEEMYQKGVTPWKDHPPEPALEEFFSVLEDFKPDARLLDIGCGDGWISILAAKKGFTACGIDTSGTAIKVAKSKAKEAKVDDKTEFLVGNGLALPYEEDFFDAIVDRGFFHHVLESQRDKYFDNILRVLKEKGLVYLSVFSEKNPETIGNRFTKEDIKRLFGGFEVLYTKPDPFPTPAPAHLIHFILRR